MCCLKPIFHICGKVYELCESDKKWKTCKCMSMISYAQLRMWFPNMTKWTTPFSNWCKSDGWIHIVTKILDSAFRFECPGRLSQEKYVIHKVRGVSETNEYRNVTYATAMSHIWNLGFKPRFHTLYVNLTKDRKHMSVIL